MNENIQHFTRVKNDFDISQTLRPGGLEDLSICRMSWTDRAVCACSRALGAGLMACPYTTSNVKASRPC